MKYRYKRKLILIVGSILFLGVAHFFSYPYKIILFCVAYVCFVFLVGRDIYKLSSKKGTDIQLSKWELDTIDEHKYEEAITCYVLSIILIGLSLFLFGYCGIRNRDITYIAIGSVGTIAGILSLMMANHIKYVLYVKQKMETTNESGLNKRLDTDRE